MKLQNSYIFIPNPDKKKKSLEKKDRIRIDVGIKVYIKNLFNLKEAQSAGDTVYKSIIPCNMTVKSNLFNVIFTTNKVVKHTYLDVQVTGKRKTQIIQCLEYIHEKLQQSDIENHYIRIDSYDSISEYYCNKIYPKLNELERKLRKLLYNTYILYFGFDYIDNTIDENIIKKLSKNIKSKKIDKNTSNEIEIRKKFFDEFEYRHYKTLLFDKQWTQADEEAKNKFLKNKTLSQLDENELRKAFMNFTPRSDWEKFFANKVGVSGEYVKYLVECVQDYRNNVAHYKTFSSKDYKNCFNSVKNLIKLVDRAIAITEEKDFLDKNMEHFKSTLARLSAIYLEFQKIMEQSMKECKNFNL